MNKAPSESRTGVPPVIPIWDGHCPACSVYVSGTNPAALGVILFLHSQSHDEKLSLSQARSLVKVVPVAALQHSSTPTLQSPKPKAPTQQERSA